MNKKSIKFKSIAIALIVITIGEIVFWSNSKDRIINLVKDFRNSSYTSEEVYKVSNLGNLQNTLSVNKTKALRAIEEKDLEACKIAFTNVLKEIKDKKTSIDKELKEAEKIVNKVDYDEARRNLEEVKEHYNQLLDEEKNIEKAINKNKLDIYTSVANNKTIFGIEVEEDYVSLGDTLPNTNIVEEPDEEINLSSISEAEDYSIDDNQDTNKEYLAETIDTKYTEEIKNKSKELGNDPLKIYEFVRNSINFQPYKGSRKGAKGTLAEYAGNDYDQSSLLISLLRCNDIPARYVKGIIYLEADKAKSWTGASNIESAINILASCGNKTQAVISGGNIVGVKIEHVWVEAYCSMNEYRGIGEDTGIDQWIPFDPSFKEYEIVEGQDLSKYINVEEKDLVNLIDHIDDFEDTKKCIINDISNKIEKNVSRQIDDFEGKTSTDILGGYKIVEENIDVLPFSIPNTLISITTRFSEIESDERDYVIFNLSDSNGNYGDLYYKEAAVNLYGQKITISYSAATDKDQLIIDNYGGIFNTPSYLINICPEIKVNERVVAKGSSIEVGENQSFKFSINRANQRKDSYINSLITGGYYSVGLDYGAISINEMEEIKKRVDKAQENIEEYGYYSDEILGEMLNCTLKQYMSQVDANNKLLSLNYNVTSTRSLSFGMTGTSMAIKKIFGKTVDMKVSSLYIDIDGDMSSVVSNNENADIQEYYKQCGMKSSALEGTIFEDLFSTPAVSTTKILNLCEERNIPIYNIDGSNINEQLNKLKINDRIKEEVINAVNSGNTVTIPRENIEYYNWNGIGYIVEDKETGSAGYMISGGLSGGSMAQVEEFDIGQSIDIFWQSFWEGFKEGFKIGLAFCILSVGSMILPAGIAIVCTIIKMAFVMYFDMCLLQMSGTLIAYQALYINGYISMQEYYDTLANLFGSVLGGMLGACLGGTIGKTVSKIALTEIPKIKIKIKKKITEKVDTSYDLSDNVYETIAKTRSVTECKATLKEINKLKDCGFKEEELIDVLETLNKEKLNEYVDIVQKYDLGKEISKDIVNKTDSKYVNSEIAKDIESLKNFGYDDIKLREILEEYSGSEIRLYEKTVNNIIESYKAKFKEASLSNDKIQDIDQGFKENIAIDDIVDHWIKNDLLDKLYANRAELIQKTGYNAKVSIMYDVKNPNSYGIATCSSWKINDTILFEDEPFNNELFKSRFNSDYCEYYEYTRSKEYLESLPDEFFEQRGVSRDSVIEEMNKLEENINKTKALAEENGAKNKYENYSLEENWNVDNCAEVWSARKAILNGAKFENLSFKCIETESGKYAKPCGNCKETFKDCIDIGDE